jgi:hypothetical protein
MVKTLKIAVVKIAVVGATVLLGATSMLATSAVAQQKVNPNRSGTAEEQRACGPDVSRFCRSIMNDGDLVVLSCLQQNRPKISRACNQVLVSHGQ